MKKVFGVYSTDHVGAALLEPIQSSDGVGCYGERSDLERSRWTRSQRSDGQITTM